MGLGILWSKLVYAYNALWGSLQSREVHQKVSFAVPDNGYHEAGVMLNSVLRLKLLGLYYATFNAGYFHNIPAQQYKNAGRFVYGIGVDL